MKKKQYRFWVSEEALQSYLESKIEEYGDFTNFARETFHLMKDNKLDPRSFDNLRKEKIIADIEWKRAQTAFLKEKLTKSIDKILEEPITAFVPPEEKNLSELINFRWNRYVETLRKMKDGWTITCKLCSTGFVQIPTQDDARNRFKKHLEETHGEELIAKTN